VRLYMVPGMQHCAGGPGATVLGQPGKPDSSARELLEDWVEKGTAPTAIIASKTAGDEPQGAVIMTRPLCPYPQAAKYKGSGDPNSADSFTCAPPSK
jgi:hypothetical protein